MSRKSQSLGHLALQKFKKNFWGVLSFTVIVTYALLALFAYVIAPDSTRNANQMHLSIHSQPPGFSTKMMILPIKEEDSNFWSFLSGST